jgi:AraC-like DNA-binding protein
MVRNGDQLKMNTDFIDTAPIAGPASTMEMPGSDSQHGIRFRDHDHLDEIMSTGGLALNVFKNRSTPLDIEFAVHRTEFASIWKVLGAPVRVSRGRAEIASDEGGFLGVLLQRTGRTVFESGSEQTVVKSGDLLIWHGGRPIRFDMPDHFQKVCLLVQRDIFESMLPQASSYAGEHLRRNNISRLLGACLSTLADDVLTSATESIEKAVELTLGMLGAALTQHRESNNISPRTSLYRRLTSFIEEQLADPDLSPAMIAQKHHISPRYLHLIFSEQGTTVGRWIRSRRLAKCRAELANLHIDRSVTEIAMNWGFNDVAHFSRLFSSAYGICPRKFRTTRNASPR